MWAHLLAGAPPASPWPAAGEEPLRVAAEPCPFDPPWLGRLAALTSPALAAWAFGRTACREAGVDEAAIEASLLRNRYGLVEARRWLDVVAREGIEVIVLKGFAVAHRLYPDPRLRAMGDVDLLVRRSDLSALVACLEAEGFRFYKSAGTPRWGLACEASFHPLVAPGRGFSFDLHVEADEFPLFRSLPAEAVFDQACTVPFSPLAGSGPARDATFRIPGDDHLTLLALSHAARDKFGPLALRALIDLVVGLGRGGLRPDWPSLIRLAHEGGYSRMLATGIALLREIGIDEGALPVDYGHRPGGLAGLLFDRLLAETLALFESTPGRLSLSLCDALLIASPGTTLHRNLRRLRGLVRPWPGIPT